MKEKSTLKKLLGSREFLLFVIVVAMFLIVSAINPAFFSFKAIQDMMKNNAVTMVMALGMLCVMLVGGIDISCMSALALSAMSIGMLFKYGGLTSTFLAFLISIVIGTACGLVVGLVISRADVPPIICTMGFMYIWRAMGYLVSFGGEWAGANVLGNFPKFGTGFVLGLSNLVWVILICYVVFFIFMIVIVAFMFHALDRLFRLGLLTQHVHQTDHFHLVVFRLVYDVLDPCVRFSSDIYKNVTRRYLHDVVHCRLIAVKVGAVFYERLNLDIIITVSRDLTCPVIFRKDRGYDPYLIIRRVICSLPVVPAFSA